MDNAIWQIFQVEMQFENKSWNRLSFEIWTFSFMNVAIWRILEEMNKFAHLPSSLDEWIWVDHMCSGSLVALSTCQWLISATFLKPQGGELGKPPVLKLA